MTLTLWVRNTPINLDVRCGGTTLLYRIVSPNAPPVAARPIRAPYPGGKAAQYTKHKFVIQMRHGFLSYFTIKMLQQSFHPRRATTMTGRSSNYISKQEWKETTTWSQWTITRNGDSEINKTVLNLVKTSKIYNNNNYATKRFRCIPWLIEQSSHHQVVPPTFCRSRNVAILSTLHQSSITTLGQICQCTHNGPKVTSEGHSLIGTNSNFL